MMETVSPGRSWSSASIKIAALGRAIKLAQACKTLPRLSAEQPSVVAYISATSKRSSSLPR